MFNVRNRLVFHNFYNVSGFGDMLRIKTEGDQTQVPPHPTPTYPMKVIKYYSRRDDDGPENL